MTEEEIYKELELLNYRYQVLERMYLKFPTPAISNSLFLLTQQMEEYEELLDGVAIYGHLS